MPMGTSEKLSLTPVPHGEAFDPPTMPMPPEVEQVDMANFGRSRMEVSHIIASRPRPSPIR
eukprot:14802663-Alexandrium_andersonii.AAC.1